jgi:hypothetical protein
MTFSPDSARSAHEALVAGAATGEPLSGPAEIGPDNLLVARYVDDKWAAFLFLYMDDPGVFEQLIEVYRREHSYLRLEVSASTDWYGPLSMPPPCQPLWISGFEATATTRDESASFASGSAAGFRYLALLRSYSSGDSVPPADAPFGPFLVRIRPA